MRRDGRAVIRISHDDAPEARLEIGKALREAEHRHDLACNGDIEPVLARASVRPAAKPVHNVPQLPVVHIDAALPCDLLRVDPEGVALLYVVVEHRREQVVRRADGVKVAGKVEVYILHRDDLGIPAAGRAALDAKHRPERRLAQRGHGVFPAAPQRVRETDGGRGLALARGRRRDGRNENELSVRRGGLFAQQVKGDLRLVFAVRLDAGLVNPCGGGDLENILQSAFVRDFDIGQSIPSYAYGVIRTEPLYIIPAAFSIIFRGAPSAPSGYGDRPAHCPHPPRLTQGGGPQRAVFPLTRAFAVCYIKSVSDFKGGTTMDGGSNGRTRGMARRNPGTSYGRTGR